MIFIFWPTIFLKVNISNLETQYWQPSAPTTANTDNLQKVTLQAINQLHWNESGQSMCTLRLDFSFYTVLIKGKYILIPPNYFLCVYTCE